MELRKARASPVGKLNIYIKQLFDLKSCRDDHLSVPILEEGASSDFVPSGPFGILTRVVMELLKSREGNRGVWLAEKVLLSEGNVRRGPGPGEWKTSQGFQVTETQLPTNPANKATAGESLARVTPSGDSLIYYTDGLTRDTFKICKEFLRPFKKCLRKLNPPKELSKEKRLSCTRKNLTVLGDHINMFLQHYCKTWEFKHWKKMLWRFVALFSALDEKQLCKLYRYSKTNQDSKFLKTYCLMECPDLITLPENHHLLKLRGSWGLCGDMKVKERWSQVCSQAPGGDLPAGKSIKKRLCKASLRSRKKEGADNKRLKKAYYGQASSIIGSSRVEFS